MNWTPAAIYSDAKKYSKRVDWYRASPGAYQAAKRLSLFDQVTAHMVKPENKIWTEEAVLSDALRFDTRAKWQKQSPSAYDAARRLDLLDIACKHMKPLPRHLQTWTEEEVLADAQQFTRRSDWKGPGLTVARKMGLLERATAHMLKTDRRK